MTFYYWPKREEGDPPPKKFLTVYRLTGSNRNARSKLADRFTLYRVSFTRLPFFSRVRFRVFSRKGGCSISSASRTAAPPGHFMTTKAEVRQ